VDWLDIHRGMRVLEVGPGVGTFTLEAASRIGDKGELLAADNQHAVVLKLTRRLQRAEVTNVTPIVATASELPYPAHTFDRVFMITVLGEIPDKLRALIEIKRVLKDDGLLAIGEFLPDPDYPRRKTVIRWCATAGFNVTKVHRSFWHYVLIFKKSRRELYAR
jgi:ubiquinone/menaquinone biosynthesis C-methylase UbiE